MISGPAVESIAARQEDIVIVDGLTNEHRTFTEQVFNHYFNEKRLAISVASMGMKTNVENDAIRSITSYQCFPWELDEYVSAAKDEQFRQNIVPFLVERNARYELQTPEEFEEAFSVKYDFAGSSARWMFDTYLDDVRLQIEAAITRVPNVVDLLKMISGVASSQSINHLICIYSNKRVFYVSKLNAPFRLLVIVPKV
jgi:hypothetical protein